MWRGKKNRNNSTDTYEFLETKVFTVKASPIYQSMGSWRIPYPVLFGGGKGPSGICSGRVAYSAGGL